MSLKLTKPDSICPVSYPSFFLSVYIVLLTRATFCFVLFCVICMFCVLVVLVRLSVPVQVIDWKRLVSETTYNVLTLTLDPTHSLTHSLIMEECATLQGLTIYSSSSFITNHLYFINYLLSRCIWLDSMLSTLWSGSLAPPNHGTCLQPDSTFICHPAAGYNRSP